MYYFLAFVIPFFVFRLSSRRSFREESAARCTANKVTYNSAKSEKKEGGELGVVSRHACNDNDVRRRELLCFPPAPAVAVRVDVLELRLRRRRCRWDRRRELTDSGKSRRVGE